MSWVTIDRVCEEESRADQGIGRLLADSGRPLRSDAAGLSDEELLAKLRGFGLDLDRHGLEQMCEGALSAEAVAAPLIAGRGFGDDSRAPGTGSGSALSPSGSAGGQTGCAWSCWTTRFRQATDERDEAAARRHLAGRLV